MGRKFAFVILHYREKTVPDTLECVRSIQENIPGQDYHIVVVENGSGDCSAVLLKESLGGDSVVTLLTSDTNLGFARGNNLGCDYATKEFSPDFLIVINNDTMIYQQDFLKKIEEIYAVYPFHILGPYIRGRGGKPQNPVKPFPVTVEEVDRKIAKLERRQRVLEKSYLRYWLMFKLKKDIRKSQKRTLLGKTQKPDERSCSVHHNVGLHGSALIFSRDYYEKYDHVFYPGTFMYKEEDILYYRVKQHNLASLYHPGLLVHHKEDSSTNAEFSRSFQKEKFIRTHQLESFKIYRDYIVKDQSSR